MRRGARGPLGVLATVATVVVMATACGRSSPRPDDAPTAASDGEATSAAGAGGTASTRGTASPATAEAGGGGASASPGKTTTTSSPTQGKTAQNRACVAATAAGPAPTAAGTYSYRQTGVSGAGTGTPVPPRGTLTVEAARPDRTQVAHRVIEPSSSEDYTFAFRPDGVFLIATEQNQGGVRIHCDFSPPLPAPAWPPATGRSFSGRGECASFTVDVEGRITGERQVTLDGAPVRVAVIESTVVTRGEVESTGRQVDWYAPDLRLVVHQEMRREGRFGTFPFIVDVTSDLESARPS